MLLLEKKQLPESDISIISANGLTYEFSKDLVQGYPKNYCTNAHTAKETKIIKRRRNKIGIVLL